MTMRSILSGSRKVSGRWWATLGLAIVVALHLLGGLPFQSAMRMLSFDLYQTLVPRPRAETPVTIVDIDEASQEKFGRWPWPRNLTARMLDRIWGMQPAVVALDFLMPEADQFSACQVTKYIPDIDPALTRRLCALPSNDKVLATALRRGKSVLGLVGVEERTQRDPLGPLMQRISDDPLAPLQRFGTVLTNLPQLGEAAAGHGILNTEMQRGVVRRMPLVASVGGKVLPSLSLEMLRLMDDSPDFRIRRGERGVEGVEIGKRFVASQDDGPVWVHYAHYDPTRVVSATQALDGKLDPKLFRNKLVLVGVSGLGRTESQYTALGERVPSVAIHAQMLDSILDGATLQRPNWALWVEGALMLVVGLAISWGFPRLGARVLLPIMVFSMVVLWLGGLAAYARASLLLDVASPISIFIVMFFFMLAGLLVREEGQRKTLTDRLVKGEARQKSLEEQSDTARGEMETARRIQMGILPDVKAHFANESRLDIAALMEPAKLVGGDLYDCFMLDEHRAYFSIGDVCGKGIPASLFMVISKTLCKSLALRFSSFSLTQLDPGYLMRQANLEISRDNTEMFFVTAVIGVFDLRTGELSYCNAGHDMPLRFAPGSPPTELEGSTSPPICVVDEYDYQTYRTRLAPGEFLCLFTDGVTEAFNAKQEMYGSERLHSALGECGQGATAQDVLEVIRSRVQ